MCVLELFERRASAFPDALAVACQDWKVSYHELNLTADRIAHGLREAGVVSGTLVGIFLDRSPELIAGLLGIWKAGGAYIPLDPAAPPQRIAFMLEDSAPPFVLTLEELSGGLPSTTAQVIYFEDFWAARNPTGQTTQDPAASMVSEESVAYVIYTSGSTGKPKGVSITHRALANTIRGVGQDLMLGTEDVVLAWSTIAFDVAGLEIFLPLAFGASLYLVETDLVNGGGSRMEQVRDSAATVIFATPTMFRLLLEEGWQGDARMQLIAGGEVLPLTLAHSLARMCRVLWNQYGPSETAICATRARIESDAVKITIGCPLPNVSIHLLDAHLQPVAQGEVGEMYIGGAGVGLGYLNRPDLNRACFLPDPFADGAHRWIYKSGDLAVQLEDGRFDFLGRVDGQVKIRGFRIELGEIESVLRGCKGVKAAVARAIELEPGDRRLVAFVVGAGASRVSQWRELLSRQLPSYMIPAEFVSVPYFPTTPGGKVDGQALDRMRLHSAPLPAAPTASPVDAVEARLMAIWKSLLKVETIGIRDDFFLLGGHSLLAARMLVQIEGWFGYKLPHSVLVEHPTIHGLATYLRHSSAERWPALVTIQAGARQPPLFIAHGIGGSLLSFIELAAQLGPEQPVYGLQLPASIDVDQADLRTVAANYLRQVRAIQPSGPYHFAGHSSGGLVVFEMACQLSEQGETMGLLALLDCDPDTGKSAYQPFRDWNSLKASFVRARTAFQLRTFGMRELLRRRIDYQRIKIKIWLAARSRRAGKADGPVEAEGYLALALRDYEFRPYPGNITLFIAQDEPGSKGEPANAWKGKVLGRCETRLIPGTHRTILTQPQVISLAREIRQRMLKNEEKGVGGVVASVRNEN
jgi:amino acid adenylation domain-containing protein